MEWVEVTAKTVAEAKEKALDLLHVDESQAEFEVLEEPRSGLFRRKVDARVRARVKPVRPRPKAERRDRRRPRSGDRPSGGREGAGEGAPVRAGHGDGTNRSGRSQEAGRGGGPRQRSGRPSRGPGEPRTSDEGQRPAAAVGSAMGALSDTGPEAAVSGETTSVMPRQGELPVDRDVDSTQPPSRDHGDGRQTEYAKEFLEGLVQRFALDASVSVLHVEDTLDELQVAGSDLGILIGSKAATLESVQELTRVVAQRRSGGRGDSRLRVDIGGYRQRRREALERFVLAQAEQVLASGAQKVLEPMNSADRKVVHDTVGTLDGVRTLSEGEEPRRRVVIVPA